MKIPTNPMYDIDELGVVRLISTGEIIPEYINHKKRRAVKIRGLSHKPSSHPLDRLMLNTYKPLPEGEDPDWWSIRFKDFNRDNISVENMEWDSTQFTPTLIPGITIDINAWIPAYGYPEIELKIFNGSVYARDSRTYQELGLRTNRDGYYLVTSPVTKEVIRFHRLIAATFLPHPLDTDHLTVNHKDSDKKNNTPFNLEWVSYSKNNHHAFSEGPRGDTIRVISILNLKDGRETIASGYNEAARVIGVKPGSIHHTMERSSYPNKPCNGHIFKYESDLRSWDEFRESGRSKHNDIAGEIVRKDIRTGEIVVYGSFKEVVNKESIGAMTLTRILKQNVLVPWKGKCFQSVDGDVTMLEWPEYPEEILVVYDETHASDRPISVENKDGSVEYYPSVTSWCMKDRENRCDPAVLSRYLKKSKGSPLQWRDWVFSHIDLSRY